MFRKSLPVVRQIAQMPKMAQQSRNITRLPSVWDKLRPSSDIQRLMRDMDRRMDAFEREFLKLSPFRFGPEGPRLGVPVEGVPDTKFRVEVDVSDFQPEDVKIQLKDGKLRVEAKMDRNENGVRYQQHLLREFTIPPKLDEKTLESTLHNDGILTIEAVMKPESAKKIEIEGKPSIDDKK